jgi:hypothetical protein
MLDVLGQLADMREQDLNPQITPILEEQIVAAKARAVAILTARAAERAAAKYPTATVTVTPFAATTADESTHRSPRSATSEEETSCSP